MSIGPENNGLLYYKLMKSGLMIEDIQEHG